MNTTHYTYLTSPLGELILLAQDDRLCGLYFGENTELVSQRPRTYEDSSSPVLKETVTQLSAYFAGELTTFDIPVHLSGTTFQGQVWQALSSIPYGTTVSYLHVAQHIGRSAAIRAVGQANGKNPISIIYPCHRVIGSNGTLTGYGGGIARKQWLLQHEKRHRPGPRQTTLF